MNRTQERLTVLLLTTLKVSEGHGQRIRSGKIVRAKTALAMCQ